MTLPPKPFASYEAMAMPTLTEKQLDAIVRHHELRLDGPIRTITSTGVVHSLWSLGHKFVLRVPKQEPMCLGDHRCESVAIPLARSAGVRTPNLVLFDDSLTILDVPYSVVERIEGTNLAASSFGHKAFEEVGVQLAKLHAADLTFGVDPWLRDTSESPAETYFDEVIAAGLLHVEGLRWLRDLCARLDAVIEEGPKPPVSFIHGDVKPDNVMVDVSGLVHLIDWGDAGFGDPAYDFQSLPLQSVDVALRGYRSARLEDPTLEARILRRIISRSLANMRRAPLAGPSWYRPIAANLTDLLTFAIDCPEMWSAWTRTRRSNL